MNILTQNENMPTAREAWWKQQHVMKCIACVAWLIGATVTFCDYFAFSRQVQVVVVVLPMMIAGVVHKFASAIKRWLMQNVLPRQLSLLTTSILLELVVVTIGWTQLIYAFVNGEDPLLPICWLLALKALLKLVILFAVNYEYRVALADSIYDRNGEA